jgi:VanZ family protein
MPLKAMFRDPAGLGRLAFFRQLAYLPLVPQIVHVAVFACLTLLGAWALTPLASMRSSILVACGGAFAFGVLVEGIQLYVPGREARLFDAFLNGFGALLGCLLGLGLGMARKPDQI